jgi:hypothetical protein
MFGWLLTKTNSNDLLATPLRFTLLILTIYLRFTSSCDPKKTCLLVQAKDLYTYYIFITGFNCQVREFEQIFRFWNGPRPDAVTNYGRESNETCSKPRWKLDAIYIPN